jgi:cysteinyl-tRNA synthetase
LANQRVVAKEEKDYALADELRNQIQEAGFVIVDVPNGFAIEKAH